MSKRNPLSFKNNRKNVLAIVLALLAIVLAIILISFNISKPKQGTNNPKNTEQKVILTENFKNSKSDSEKEVTDTSLPQSTPPDISIPKPNN